MISNLTVLEVCQVHGCSWWTDPGCGCSVPRIKVLAITLGILVGAIQLFNASFTPENLPKADCDTVTTVNVVVSYVGGVLAIVNAALTAFIPRSGQSVTNYNRIN